MLHPQGLGAFTAVQEKKAELELPLTSPLLARVSGVTRSVASLHLHHSPPRAEKAEEKAHQRTAGATAVALRGRLLHGSSIM